MDPYSLLCTGSLTPKPDLVAIWSQDNVCWDYYYNILFSKGGRPAYNPERLAQVQTDFTTLINNYFNQGYSFTQPGDNRYNTFQEILIQICNRYPGGCQPFLEQWCPNNTNLETISGNSGLINFCGCYIKGTDYGITQQCQPLCHRVSTVKLSDGSGGLLQCTDDVCVIDNVSISAAQTTSRTTNVSFTQVCQCPAGRCKCILSNNNFFGLVGEVSFKQACGDGSKCYVASDNPNATPIPTECPEIVEPPTPQQESDTSYAQWIPWFIMIIVVFLVFLVLVF